MNIFPAKKKGFIVHIHLVDETCMYTLFHKSLKYDQIKITFHDSNLFYAIYFSSLIVGKSLKYGKALFGLLNYNELIFHFVQPKEKQIYFPMCLRHYNVIYIIVNSNVFPICRQQKHRSHMLSHGYSCFYSIFSANLNYSETFTRKYWSKWLPCPTNDFLFHDRVRNMRRFSDLRH